MAKGISSRGVWIRTLLGEDEDGEGVDRVVAEAQFIKGFE